MCASPSLEGLLRAAATSVLHNTKCQSNTIVKLCCIRTSATEHEPLARLSHVADAQLPGGTGAPTALAVLAQPAPLPTATWRRSAAYNWKPHELEALVAILRSADLTRRLPIRKGLEAVGWASLPDPDGILYRRVKKKLNIMLTRMRHGEEPVPEPTGKQQQNKAATWTAWIRAALAHVGDGEFTSLDVMAMLEANPDISPMLDRSPDPYFKTRLRWQSSFSYGWKKVPGLVWTGRKRGRCLVYRYDPTDPTAVPAKPLRQRKKGVPGLPHLGRHEGSKGDAATAGQ